MTCHASPARAAHVGLLAATMIAAACHDAEEDAYQARRAAAEKDLTSVQDQLKAVEAAWPDTAAAKACDDAALQAIAKDPAAQTVVSIAWPVVQKHAARHSDEASPPTPSHHLLERLSLDSATDVTAAAELLKARPLWGVWRAATTEAADVVDASSMSAGSTTGAYVLFDGPKATPLCWFPVSAASSATVGYRAAEGESEDMKKEKAALAVGADLAMQTEAAIRATLPTASALAKLPAGPLSER